jgi:hypothetical protein
MKKSILLFVLVFITNLLKAQLSLTNITPACDSNGVISINYTGANTGAYKYYIYKLIGFNFSLIDSILSTSNTVTYSYTQGGIYYYIELRDVNNTGLANNTITATSLLTATRLSAPTINTSTCAIANLVTFTPTGGTAPYTYNHYNLWGNGALVSTANSAMLDYFTHYETLIEDANGCKTVINYLDSNNNGNGSLYNTTINPASCTNGSITINSMVGNTGPYIHTWSNGQTGNAITNLTSGNYTVTTTDNIGCSFTEQFYVGQNPNIYPIVVSVPNTCGQQIGSLTVTNVIGGTAPYTYQWSNGSTTSQQLQLSTGTYNLTITDANGCFYNGNQLVSQNTNINGSITSSNTACNLPTGTAYIAITSGSAPYTYQWNNGATSSSIINLNTGFYNVVVTDAIGCTKNFSTNISYNYSINIFPTIVPEVCGNGQGSINVIPSGGVAPYTYLWSNGSTTSSRNNLSIGGYGVTVTDANGCVTNATPFVNNNSPINAAANVVNASCKFLNDGQVSATILGGTPPYTLTWSGVVTGNANTTFTNVNQGYGMLQVVDAVGCTASDYFQVDYNVNNNSCYCTAKGKIYYDINGNCIFDAGEYAIPNYPVVIAGYGTVFTNANGDYSVDLQSNLYTVSVLLSTNMQLSSCQNNFIPINIVAGTNCTIVNDFAMNIIPILDLSVYSYSLDVPRPGFVYNRRQIVTNYGNTPQANILAVNDIDASLLNVSSTVNMPWNNIMGNYFTTNGSTTNAINPYDIKFTNFSMTVPSTTAIGSLISFYDTVATSGPASNYVTDNTPSNNIQYDVAGVMGAYDPNYKDVVPHGFGSQGILGPKDSELVYVVHFQNEGNYYAQDVVVLDTLSPLLNWSSLRPVFATHPCKITMENGVLKYNFENILLPSKFTNDDASKGHFVFRIKLNSSLAPGTVINNKSSIYFDFNDPIVTNSTINTIGTPLTLNPTIVYTSCNGTVNTNIVGGYGNITTSPSNINQLSNGTYTITASDQLGFIASSVITINNSNGVNITSQVTQPSCSGGNGTVSIAATGGNGALTISPSGTSFAAGTYTFVASDANGCSANTIVVINNVVPMVMTTTITNPLCYGGNGSVQVNTTGGTGTVNILPNTFNNLAAGSYTYTATDANGCTSITNVTIQSASSAIMVNGSSLTGSGVLQFYPTGGVAPYSITMNGMPATSPISNLATGNYTLVATDANGCTVSEIVIVTNSPQSLNNISNSTLNLYPNPANEKVTIKFDAAWMHKDINVEILDVKGSVVYATKTKVNTDKMIVDIRNLNIGLYVIKVRSEGAVYFNKISVQR